MKKEDFAAELKRLKKAEIDAALAQEKLLREYATQYPFQPGDKVAVVLGYKKRPEAEQIAHEAYILNVCVHNNGDMFPRLLKTKADGTPSKHRLYSDNMDLLSITKIP